MFKNIGKTIRIIAIIMLVLDVIASIALAVLCFLSGKNVFAADPNGTIFGFTGGNGGAALSLITGFCGIIALLCLYGYGQQIENIKLIRESFEAENDVYDEEDEEDDDEDEESEEYQSEEDDYYEDDEDEY